jgi:hypothetical protein
VLARTGEGIAMKMKATIKVEFEANEGQPQHALEAALIRGRCELADAIELGSGGLPTGIKRGSVKTKIVEKRVE